jgi:8-oxo-dGTP diphosphatase
MTRSNFTTHVAVAVIVNSQQAVLLALRHAHQHQGNLWEFPGGKVEAGERVYDALLRETQEELGVMITEAEPLLQVSHDYMEKTVLLDVWRVTQYSGHPRGQEGQRLRWCPISDLKHTDFPAANVAIIQALQTAGAHL